MTSAVVTPERLGAARRAVVSSSIGAALEWFDIIVYASFAVVIVANFLPGGNGSRRWLTPWPLVGDRLGRVRAATDRILGGGLGLPRA